VERQDQPKATMAADFAPENVTMTETGTRVPANSPNRIARGITRKYEVTDRNLDFDGEDGYPTPT